MRDATLLAAPPNIPVLLARAALSARGRGGALPETRLRLAGVRVDQSRLAAYDRVCRYPLTDALPPTYPQVLALPLQLALMADRSFPLALPGLVHVRNRIEVQRPLDAGELLDITVWADRFAAHRRGATVDLISEVRVGSEPVWQGRSTYLARGAQAPVGAPESDLALTTTELSGVPTARWHFGRSAGRQYAAVSGDVNPIHLSALTARMFGFKRSIAHGMWVNARVLAALSGRLPDAVSVDVVFRQPAYLPSTVSLTTHQVGDGWDFTVRNARSAEPHLIGTVRPS